MRSSLGEEALMRDESHASEFADVVREVAVRARHEHKVLGDLELIG